MKQDYPNHEHDIPLASELSISKSAEVGVVINDGCHGARLLGRKTATNIIEDAKKRAAARNEAVNADAIYLDFQQMAIENDDGESFPEFYPNDIERFDNEQEEVYDDEEDEYEEESDKE